MADDSEQAIGGKKKHRSPNYPSFNLETAIIKAKKFYDAQGRNPIHFDVAMQTLGYTPGSGAGLRCVATMIGYGLLTESGKGDTRQVKLSPQAYSLLVVLDEEDAAERLNILREMAMRPRVYGELAARYPNGLPTDAAIQKVLKAPPLDFNPAAVEEAVKDFRATYEFAQLANRGILSEDESDKNGNGDGEGRDESDAGIKLPTPPKPPGGGSGGKGMQGQLTTNTFAIPMQNGREILLQAPEKPTKADLPYLDLLTSYIDLLKQRARMEPEPSDSTSEDTQENG